MCFYLSWQSQADSTSFNWFDECSLLSESEVDHRWWTCCVRHLWQPFVQTQANWSPWLTSLIVNSVSGGFHKPATLRSHGHMARIKPPQPLSWGYSLRNGYTPVQIQLYRANRSNCLVIILQTSIGVYKLLQCFKAWWYNIQQHLQNMTTWNLGKRQIRGNFMIALDFKLKIYCDFSEQISSLLSNLSINDWNSVFINQHL